MGDRLRAHGVRGEVCFRSLSGLPERFRAGLSVVWRDHAPTGRPDRTLTIEAVREQGETVFARFAGAPDRTAAEALAGGTLWAAAGTSPPLEPGTYYHHQLIGMRVLDEDGADLGCLTGILSAAHDSYEVAMDDGRRFLVPAVAAFIREVDVPGGRIVIRTLPGLVPDLPRPRVPRRRRGR